MVSKNNVQVKDRYVTKQVPHYGIRKLSVGVASVLLGTTFYMGMNGNVVHADTVNGQDSETPDSQVANSNTNSESKSGTGANAALGNSQAVVSVAEDVVKNEVNTKPQVTEIKNDSHVQSDAANAKSDVDENTQSDANAAKSDVDANAQSQNDQNHANATQTMRVMHVASQAGNILPNAVSANLTESTDDTVMQQAIQQTSALRDDRSTDYAGYIKGQTQSVTLKDGSSLSVNSDVINSDTDQSAILTFKSASFKPGDTYTILIPHIMMRNESDVAHLQPSFGTTTVDELHLNDGKYYWKIVDRFVNSGTVSQAIKLSRITGLNIDDLNNYFSSADFWRPYDLIHGTINLIKGTDRGSLDFKYQLGYFRENLYPYYNLANGNLNYPLLNGQAYDFNVYLSTVSLIKNDSYDGFGLGKDVLKNVSLSIENDHDYLKLNNPVANIYNDLHQLIGTMSVKADHGKLIFSDLKLNDTVPVIGSLVRSPDNYDNIFNITFNATVNVPKQLFNGNTFTFSSAVDDFSFTFNNPKVGSVKPGNPVAWIKVLPDLNSLSTGNLISYSQSHNYMDLGASDYTDGNKQIVNRTVDHDDIPGVRRYSGFNVNSMNLSVNGLTLSNFNYHLDIPDGFDLYSLKFDDFDHITSVIIRLKDGTSYKISSDDLRSHLRFTGRIVSVGLNRSEYRDLQLDSNSSIASVDIKYHDVDSSVDLEPVLLGYASQNYRIAPTYASGKPVQVGDLLKFTATISSTDPHVKIDSAPIVLDDVLITDPNNDTLRVYHDITSEQSNKTPGVVNAGNLFYTDSNYFDRGFPHLKHAVAYLQVPDNASLTDIKKIAVESGINREYGDLTPKSISLVKVANGVTFIKVDLSNYNDIRAGFNISVPYSNIGDLQTSRRPSSMLVVSDNFDQNFEGVQHFSSDIDSRTDAAVKALINQENIDVNKTDYQGSIGHDAAWWDILTSDGITSATMTKGNVNSGPSMDSKQDDHAVQADRFDLYGSTISATDHLLPGAVQIINVPGTSDGHSQFNSQLTGPIHVIDANTGKNLDDIAHVTYSQSPALLRNDSLTSVANEIRLTAGQVTDWSKIKSIAIHMDVPKRTSARAVLSMQDPQIYDHVGKTIYIANAIFSTQADSPASEYHLKPIVINAGDPASAKLTVAGQSTVKTVVHYHDAQGDHYVELPDKAQTYTELQDVMKRSDFLQSDADLTVADRALLPAGMVLDYAYPKIKNSNETYLNNYQNGTAAFGQQVKYDFDQDQVIFEGSMPTQASDTKTVTETIHYVYANGSKAGQKAADDVTKSVEFSRAGFKNPFTGDIQWMKATDSKTFDAVKSPEIKGYQADQSEIGTQTVTQDSNNIEKTVKYTAQQQKMTINYIDDDAAGKVLHTDVKTGLSNETADYTTANEISTLAGQHYVLVSDDTKGQKPVYDADVNEDQVFNVHVKHATHSISDSRTVTETVHYQAADGSQVPNDHLAKANFSRTGTHDEVIGADHWNAWNISSYDFDAVPTPVKTGYTPDIQTVPAETVTPASNNIQKVVTYTPDAQKLSVKFIDDTTGKVLKTVTKTGVTNTNAGYNTQSDIQSYEGQHYVLVSDSSNGVNLVFDNNDSTDQAYEVHLKHGTHQIDEHHTITQTVHYIATDHAGVPDDHTASVQFDRDGYHDEVTGQDHWNAWKQGGTQTFSAVPTPAKTGYTPDIETISAVTVKPTDPDQKTTVTYTPDTQKLDIVFIDDTIGKTLKTVAKSGPTNSNVGYNTKSDINSYEGQHYVLVSDSSNGASLVFDDQTGIDQHYEVHLKHGTHQVSDRRIITETVHYKMADGTQAPEDHTANVQFDRTGSHDEVTGVDTWNTWTPSATQQFAAVPSPAVSGYTPDTDQVAAQTVGPDAKDTAVIVTYSPNVQIAHVKYIDDTDHKVLTQDDLNGRTGETSDYHTTDRIIEFKGQRYKFVSDNYPVDGMTFDNNDHVDQQYEVHLVHDTRTDEQDVQVPRTITYVYQNGQQAQPDHSDALKFHETKVVDLVDGHTVSDDWTPAQDFETVTTPTIQGYTPDRASVSNIGITHGHPAITEKVTYNPDAQKAVVKYIDDTTGEQLSAKDLSGYSDESTGYTTKDAIDGYTAKRYVLVSDGTQGQTIAFDHNDATDQVYEVHFKHGTEPTSESRTKKIVVHYSYVDGLARTGKAADDQIATDLTFSRTGTRDLVTDHIAWNAWDKSSQTFDAINSPAIQGYTPDRTVVGNITVNPDSHDLTEVTVTYNADSQKLSVDFIDDTTGKTLKTINKIGYSDENAGYNTKSDIQDFISKHYDLISDQTNGENLVFDHDDKTDQYYEVHLTHHLAPITDSREVNKTIHYQYADGAARNGKAADDYNAQVLNFSRTGNHDDVTGIDHWNAWTPASQNFNEVQSPVIAGYTPDKSVIDQQAVNAESPDIDLTVTYAPDAQKLDVVYIDDTDHGKVLKTITKTGGSDEAVGYNTKADIQTFVDGHYKLDRDTSNGANLVFDHDDAVDQHYEVHLTHTTKPISEAKSTNETIRYQLADGTKAFDDYTAKVNFSRTGFNDLVTNIDHWNDWTPAVEQNFNAIQSPVKQGYTPDHAQIDAITVHPGDADTARTVIYSPDAQTVTIDYLDDVTGKTLQTKTITGVSDVDTGYTTAETINNYEGQHYKLVSDNTNGDQLVFDHDDATDQHYEVHLTHTYKSVNDSATVNEVIHYQYADGTQAKPDHKAEALNFSRTGTQDLVDNNIAWNAWTPSQQVFASVNTPAVGGYTPDIETVAPVTVSHDAPDVERTVIYHADDQTILVHYIDDDTQSTLKTDSIIGKTSQKSGYKTGKTIDGYKQAGYDLVSDDTNGDELVFDNDSTKAQVYNVHLKHRHQAASDSDTVKQTVHYVYNDGSKAADDYTATPIEFTRTGDTDLVTGKTTWNAWTPTSQTFKAVPSPVIAGYTPGRATIDHIDVHAGDPDIDETVTYVPDAQRIVVNYIDSVTHQTLKTDTLDGRSDQSTNYNTQKNIDGYKNQHYTLVSDDTQGQNLAFDHDDQATQVYNVVLGHETEIVHRAHTVSETIDYKYADGTEAAPTKTAEPKTFSQSGVHDLVTNAIDWNGQWSAPQTFDAVESPEITGFTPDHAVTEAVTVDHDSQDVYKLVVYTANKQAAKINYVDDVTGKTLETDTAAGHFGEQISFGRDVNDQIKQFENQGYKLVSNNFNGQKYQADDNDNVFEVHLTHQHQAVSEPDTVTETVKYQYADGTQAAKDSAQSAEFTRTGDKDLVTGTIAWMPSTETHQFDAVDSPAIDGFTPDVQSVPAATVKFGDRDITKVATYTANDQNAGIKIIDDTAGDVLNTQTATGKFGQTIEFKIDPDTQVADLYGQGYELVSDNFSHQKYQSDNTKNQFEIHVRHQTVPATRTSAVTETVHYQDRNGRQLVPDTHETKTFTETGVTDKVTGKTTWNTTGTQTFDAVKVPTVTGYTPDRTEVPSVDVRFGDHNIDETVIYTPDSETAQIKYIDDVTGNVLLTDNTSGDYGSTIEFDHNPSSQINQYESQGYKLVSNSYGDQTHQFSATPSDNQFEVHLTHQTKDVSRTKTVTRTINYVDAQTGNKLRPSDQQTLTFTEHGTMDLVTGKTTWVTAPVQHFAKVAVPDIDGYTHQMQTVDSQTADFDSDDFEVTVPYTKVQTPNVPDTGTPTGSQSTPGTVTPTGGEDIPTGTQTINGQRQVISTTDKPQHQPVQNNSQAQTLPQTGNSEQNGAALAGLGLIGMVGSLFGFKKKRD